MLWFSWPPLFLLEYICTFIFCRLFVFPIFLTANFPVAAFAFSNLPVHYYCGKSDNRYSSSLQGDHPSSCLSWTTAGRVQVLVRKAPESSSTSLLSSSSSSDSTHVHMTYTEALSKAASEAIGRSVSLSPTIGGGSSGGGGATTMAVTDGTTKYFCKAASDKDMLLAEYTSVKALAATNTIKVPTPICYGEYQNRAFVLFEYLNFCSSGQSGGGQYELGQQLARLHQTTSVNGQYGFEMDNTIGATFQPNGWMDSWDDFWDTHRLGHMLQLTDNAGYPPDKVDALRRKTRLLLSHQPPASLLHGDLWGGNKGFCKINDDNNNKVVPCIFDPATYYGDRETDVAMTYLFGGFTPDFYTGYESVWPLPAGHETRRTVYNLYHILNHQVLFGGGYLSQARSMIEKILRS